MVHWAFELGRQNHWGTEVQRHLLQAVSLTFKEDDQDQFLSFVRVVRKTGRSPFDLMLGKMVCFLLGATGSEVEEQEGISWPRYSGCLKPLAWATLGHPEPA